MRPLTYAQRRVPEHLLLLLREAPESFVQKPRCLAKLRVEARVAVEVVDDPAIPRCGSSVRRTPRPEMLPPCHPPDLELTRRRD